MWGAQCFSGPTTQGRSNWGSWIFVTSTGPRPQYRFWTVTSLLSIRKIVYALEGVWGGRPRTSGREGGRGFSEATPKVGRLGVLRFRGFNWANAYKSDISF